MQRQIAKIIILLFLPVLGFSQVKLEKKSLLDNKIEILVPVGFQVMPQKIRDLKYPNGSDQFSMVLTDQNAEVTFW